MYPSKRVSLARSSRSHRFTRVVRKIEDTMTVKANIDAAYRVHQNTGKSHTGCAIVLGNEGPLFSKSAKQKIVTKSSTEAELVGLSDTAGPTSYP